MSSCFQDITVSMLLITFLVLDWTTASWMNE